MPARADNPENRCLQCGGPMRWPKSYFCVPCSRVRGEECGKAQAGRAVALEIYHGRIPHPSTLKCADCGVQAQEYDHRDYAKPLVVEPTCRGCNNRRGPGKWLKHLPLRDLLLAEIAGYVAGSEKRAAA